MNLDGIIIRDLIKNVPLDKITTVPYWNGYVAVFSNAFRAHEFISKIKPLFNYEVKELVEDSL